MLEKCNAYQIPESVNHLWKRNMIHLLHFWPLIIDAIHFTRPPIEYPPKHTNWVIFSILISIVRSSIDMRKEILTLPLILFISSLSFGVHCVFQDKRVTLNVLSRIMEYQYVHNAYKRTYKVRSVYRTIRTFILYPMKWNRTWYGIIIPYAQTIPSFFLCSLRTAAMWRGGILSDGT